MFCFISRARFPAVRHTPPFLFTASLSERPLAVPSPLSERGWLRSTLIGTRLHKLTDIQAATATSPLGEGCPQGGVCRTIKPNITTITAITFKAFNPNINVITFKAFNPNINAIPTSPSSPSSLSNTSFAFSFYNNVTFFLLLSTEVKFHKKLIKISVKDDKKMVYGNQGVENFNF